MLDGRPVDPAVGLAVMANCDAVLATARGRSGRTMLAKATA